MTNNLELLDYMIDEPDECVPYKRATDSLIPNIYVASRNMGFAKWRNLNILVTYYKDGFVNREFIETIFNQLDELSAQEVKIAYEVGMSNFKQKGGTNG